MVFGMGAQAVHGDWRLCELEWLVYVGGEGEGAAVRARTVGIAFFIKQAFEFEACDKCGRGRAYTRLVARGEK